MYYVITDQEEQWYITGKLWSRDHAETLLGHLEAGRFPHIHQPGTRSLKIVTVYQDHDYPRTNVDARKIP